MKILLLATLLFVALTETANATSQLRKNVVTISTNDGPVIMTEEFIEANSITRTFTNSEKVMYQSQVTALEDGFIINTMQGHPTQLGTYQLNGNQLRVTDKEGELLWQETIEYPLCPPELAAEFIKAFSDKLASKGDTVECVIPIIKAKKVAPVKWVRMENNENGEQVIELRPNSFGMRFFLKTTRFTISPDGSSWLSQNGQFESTRDPDKRARYLKGSANLEEGRTIQTWARWLFGMKSIDS